MDEKPKCSQDVEPLTLQPSTKKENSEDEKDQLVLSKQQSPTTGDQSAYSEDHSDAAKTLTILSKDPTDVAAEQSVFSTGHSLIILPNQLCASADQPVFSTDQSIRPIDGPIDSEEKLVMSKEEPTYSKQNSPYLKSQTVLMINQPILSIEKPIYLSDHPVGAEEQFAVPETHNVLAKDQSIFSAVQPIHEPEQPEVSDEQPRSSKEQLADEQPRSTEEHLAVTETNNALPKDQSIFKMCEVARSFHASVVPETQTVLAKDQSIFSVVQPIHESELSNFSDEQPRSSEDQLAVPETQNVLAKDQSIFSAIQPIHLPEQPEFSNKQPRSSEEQLAVLETRSVLEKDQSFFSAIQPNHLPQQPKVFDEQPRSTEEHLADEQPRRSEKQLDVTETQTILAKDQSIFSAIQPINLPEQPGVADGKPRSSEEQLTDEQPRSTEEPLAVPETHNVLPKDQSIFSKMCEVAKSFHLSAASEKETVLAKDQPIVSAVQSFHVLEQLEFSGEQPRTTAEHLADEQSKSSEYQLAVPETHVLPKNQSIFSKMCEVARSFHFSTVPETQTILANDQSIFSAEQSIHEPELPEFSDEQPRSLEENSAVPETQNILEKNQSVFSTFQLIPVPEQTEVSGEQLRSIEEQLTVTETQNILPKDQSIFSKMCEVAKSFHLSAASEKETVLAKGQSIFSAVQHIHEPEQSEFSNEQPRRSEEQSAMPETQKVLTMEKLTEQSVPSIEQPGCSKDQPIYSIDQPVSLQSFHSMNVPRFTLDQPTCSKHQPTAYSKNESALSRKYESLFPEEQTGLTINYIDPTVHESSSSREFLIAPKIVEAASTKYVSVFLKNEVAKLLGKSINIEYGVNMCAPRGASVNCMKNGYFISANNPLKINTATQSPSIPEHISVLPAPAAVATGNQPASLFLQALSKLNEASLSLAVFSHFRLHSPSNFSRNYTFLSGDISPPDSLTSAPPTYSFVLRQIAGRRRPRFMGSFFPSPSFVQRTPPPTYTGAFDVYVEPALPPPPMRTYSLGYNSMPVICPECGYTGMTVIRARVTVCTHCCAFILCILCCWICAPLPYLLTSCKDVYHYCRNCRTFLGMYCPSNPDATSVYPNDLNR